MPIKNHTIENVNGTDMLFQLPDAFVPSSLKVIEYFNATEVTRGYEVLGEVFFKLDPAPQAGANLICYYETKVQDLIGIDTLSDWEKHNIEIMMSTIAYQEQTIRNLRNSLNNRVTVHEFNTYIEVLEKKLKDIQTAMLLYQAPA